MELEFPESKVGIERRYLVIDGIVSEKALRLVDSGLPAPRPENATIVFLEYSIADYPVGKLFERVFLKDNPAVVEETQCRVIAVTQQFGKPFEYIPHGWKTICLLEFEKRIPELVLGLPTLDTWDVHEKRVILSSHVTWEKMIKLSA